MDPDLVAVLFCLAGSALFSASETALTSLPVTRVEAMRHADGRLTRAVLDRWATDPQELLITILIGNNLVNVLASALATRLAYRLSASWGLAVAVGATTLVILVLGEITPKTLAQRHAQWVTTRVAPILYLLHLVLAPVSRVLGLLTRLLSRRRSVEAPVTEEDLLLMLRLAHREAQLPRDARTMIESVLRFYQAVAREVMVPRPMVEVVDASWSRERLHRVVSRSIHSRFPVVRGSPDALAGVLHAGHLLRLEPDDRWIDLVLPPLYVPQSKALPDLLQEFRSSGQHLAVVLDEFGGFAGIVTLEDVLEIVVGEIVDELDLEREAAVVRIEGGWLVPGYLSLRRLESLLERTLEPAEGIESVGGLAAERLGERLASGASFPWSGLELEVTELEQGRPARLRVRFARDG